MAQEDNQNPLVAFTDPKKLVEDVKDPVHTPAKSTFQAMGQRVADGAKKVSSHDLAIPILVGVGAAVLAPVAITGAVTAMGFSAGGIVSGTTAASWMASYGGTVVSGSLVAGLQSIGAAGLPAASSVLVSTIGGIGAGTGTYLVTHKDDEECVKVKVETTDSSSDSATSDSATTDSATTVVTKMQTFGKASLSAGLSVGATGMTYTLDGFSKVKGWGSAWANKANKAEDSTLPNSPRPKL